MLILRNESEIHRITNSAIREIVTLRLEQLAPSASPATPCEFIVVEGGDAVSEIEQAAGFPILTGLFDDLPFDHPDFYPIFELMKEHDYEQDRIYEMVAISDDDGTATAILVPDHDDVARDLLAMCRSWATPAVSTP